MIEFIKLNLVTILVILVVLIEIIYALSTKKFRELAYSLFLEAEKRYPDGSGRIKMSWVVMIIYPKLPYWLTFIIKEQDIVLYLQKLYDKSKDYLDDGIINDSNKDQT